MGYVSEFGGTGRGGTCFLPGGAVCHDRLLALMVGDEQHKFSDEG